MLRFLPDYLRPLSCTTCLPGQHAVRCLLLPRVRPRLLQPMVDEQRLLVGRRLGQELHLRHRPVGGAVTVGGQHVQ